MGCGGQQRLRGTDRDPVMPPWRGREETAQPALGEGSRQASRGRFAAGWGGEEQLKQCLFWAGADILTLQKIVRKVHPLDSRTYRRQLSRRGWVPPTSRRG